VYCKSERGCDRCTNPNAAPTRERQRPARRRRSRARDSSARLDMHHTRGRPRAAGEPRAKDARRRKSTGDAHSNAKDCRVASTKQTTTTTKTKRENLLEKDDDDEDDDDEKKRSSRGVDASVAEATMQRVEEVEKQQGNLGASTSSRLDESETSVELWDELEDLSPRFFHGKSPTIPDGLGLMRAPRDLSTPQTSRLALPVSVIDHAVVAMLAYDVYIEPTSGGAFSPIRGDRENDRSPSFTAILPTTNHLVSSKARLPPKTTMTTTKKPLGDACTQRREYERLRSAERRRKQTPEQRERERIRSQQRRARMTDEQKRAAADAKFRRRAALKASKMIEDRAHLR